MCQTPPESYASPAFEEADSIPSGELSSAASPLPRQSILKKPRSESIPRRKSVTVEEPQSDGSPGSRGDLSKSLTETLPSNSTRLSDGRAASVSKKRAGFVAATAAKSKTRPTLGRRKGTQGMVQQASDQPKAPKSPLKTSGGNIALEEDQNVPSTRPASTLPISVLPCKFPARCTVPH